MEASSSNVDASAKSKSKERIDRLHKLHLLRTTGNFYLCPLNFRLKCYNRIFNSARKLNHAEVVAEDARNKLPANFEVSDLFTIIFPTLRQKVEYRLENFFQKFRRYDISNQTYSNQKKLNDFRLDRGKQTGLLPTKKEEVKLLPKVWIMIV